MRFGFGLAITQAAIGRVLVGLAFVPSASDGLVTADNLNFRVKE